MTRAFSFLLASLLGLMVLSSCQTTRCRNTTAGYELHPSQKVVDLFYPANAYRHLIPYEVNLYGIHIFQNDLNWRDVEKYILWYFDHLNASDKYGLSGTIYDYSLDNNGGQTSTNTYDSVDAYAATFIMLLHAYYQKVGNQQIFNYYQKEIKKIAGLMLILKDEDGLTRAVPHLDVKYLMDNCEVYGGLKAYVALARKLRWPIPATYTQAINEVKQSVWTNLYNTTEGIFHWALFGKTVHASNWHRFYPDAIAQLFPIIYDLIDPSSPEARRIWNSFHGRYGMGDGFADHLQSMMIYIARDRVFVPQITGNDKNNTTGEK